MTDEDFTIALNFRLLPFIISGAQVSLDIGSRDDCPAPLSFHFSHVICPKMSLSLFGRSLLLFIPYYY